MDDLIELLITGVGLGVLIGVAWWAQMQARRKGQEIDFLSPRGDPTRHILASLILRGAIFRNSVIRNLRNPFLARAAEPALEMNQFDMGRRALRDGDLVHITSRRGSQIAAVKASVPTRSHSRMLMTMLTTVIRSTGRHLPSAEPPRAQPRARAARR